MTILAYNNFDDLDRENEMLYNGDKKPNWEQSLSRIEPLLTQFNYKKKTEKELLLETCKNSIDYADVHTLLSFMEPYGSISSREETGATLKQQRKIAKAIRRARSCGFIPFTFL